MGIGSLFSPEPETRPPTSLPHSSNNQRLPPSASSTALPDPLRASNQQQARPGSSGEGSGDPVVNVQKLESIAPEFQQMLKEAPPSSILVTADGQPSPRKREEEKRKEQERSTSGHSSSHSSTQRGPSQPSERAPSSQERSQDKAVSNHDKAGSGHEKVSLHRPGPASVSREPTGKGWRQQDNLKFRFQQA